MPTRSHTSQRRSTAPRAIAVSVLVGLACAFWSVTAISLSPPGIQPRQLEIGVAATHVMLDAPDSIIVDPAAVYTDLPTFVKRASLYGSLIGSRPLRDRIGERIGVPADRIAALSQLRTDVDRAMREPASEQRAHQIASSSKPYRLELQPDTNHPILHVYAQAPTSAQAIALADAAVAALRDHLREAADASRAASGEQVRLVQLDRARGAVMNGSAKPLIFAFTFLVASAIALALLLGGAAVRRQFAAAGRAERGEAGDDERAGEPRPHAAARVLRRLAPALRAPRRRSAGASLRMFVSSAYDWPRTTRVLPWMIAGFMVILWLVPFNVIELTASLPFDLKFDRLVLPILFATWVLALASGGPAAPRPRITPIHVGIGALVAVACVGFVLNARYLNQTLELELPVKKLTLLLSYALLFLIIASAVRPTEVGAFLKFTLGLAVICAVGVIWEYRFRYNFFHTISDTVLPGFFRVEAVDPNAIDDIGRRMTRGPAEHPLETVAMLSMAIPIALVGVIHSKQRRAQVLYGLAACILLAAAISTYRKSALLAPLAVGLTIVYFRRRELLRLAPLGVVSIVAIHALSPGALGSILFQFHPERLGVSTVSDRSADYDAIRPDVWTNLLFGRGYGSYDHVSYRVLDSEILSRLVDTGVLGLLSLVFMVVTIVATARGPIRSRHPLWSPPALAVAAAAVAFLVLAFLFDLTSFPHTPYILMSLAGLLAATQRPAATAGARAVARRALVASRRPAHERRERSARSRSTVTR
jgi:hypothetical protein